MNSVCGSFLVKPAVEFRDYTDLDEYVTQSGGKGILLGEDASTFFSFFAVEVHEPFTGTSFRIGVISNNVSCKPVVCPIHRKSQLAIGMNKCVQIVDLIDHSVVARLNLVCDLFHLLCNGRVLAAVHELGAVVMQLSNLKEVAVANCEVVAEATLSDDTLVLVSVDNETTQIDVTAIS